MEKQTKKAGGFIAGFKPKFYIYSTDLFTLATGNSSSYSININEDFIIKGVLIANNIVSGIPALINIYDDSYSENWFDRPITSFALAGNYQQAPFNLIQNRFVKKNSVIRVDVQNTTTTSLIMQVSFWGYRRGAGAGVSR